MDVAKLGAPRPTPATTPGTAPRLGLQTGQVLQATVVGRTAADVVLLNINQTRVSAQTSLGLTPGQVLSLKVADTVPVVRLQVQSATTRPDDTVARALRDVLPKVSSTPELFRSVIALHNHQSSPQVRLVAQQLLNAVPTPENVIHAAQLKTFVMNSGVLLENKLRQMPQLSNATNIFRQDFKANLLQVTQLLRSQRPQASTSANAPREGSGATTSTQAQQSVTTVSPGKISYQASTSVMTAVKDRAPQASTPNPQQLQADPGRQLGVALESALARVVSNQLQSFAQSDPQAQVLVFDLPLKDGDAHNPIEMRIERRDRGKGEHDESGWRLDLSVELGRLGALQARIAFSRGEVSAALWAVQANTAQMMEHHLQVLEQGMQAAGLNLRSLSCGGGGPAPWQRGAVTENYLELSA